MRNLTIKREKSFVGCLTKARIYVYDEELGDTKINGDLCYKLGELKNGQEASFIIGDEETKIYVIQDKFSKNMCNEMYIIPAGYEDIYLMGECKYNPFAGNNFRFHGVTDERVLANRKKVSKKFGVFLAICCVVGGVCGFLGSYDPPQYAKDGELMKFTDVSGVVLTLTDSFEEFDADGFDFSYTCEDVAILGFSEDFETYPDLKDYTVKEYGELTIEYGGFGSEVKLQEQGGLNYFEFVSDEYKYFACVYKTENAFWVIQFSTDTAQYDSYRSDFAEWARSVEFAK